MFKHLVALTFLGTTLLAGVANAATKGTAYTLKMGSLTSLALEKDGVVKSYTFSKTIGDLYLSEYGHLSAGATTRCDPYVGSTQKEIVVKTTILNRDRQVLATPEVAKVHIPADTRVYGRCGEKTNELVAVTFQRGNSLKIWVRGENDVPSDDEALEAKTEDARLKMIVGKLSTAQEALTARNYPELRTAIGAIKAENLNAIQSKQLESLILNTPAAERSVGGYMHSSSYAPTFNKMFASNLDQMTTTEFLKLFKSFADGNVAVSDDADSIGPAGALHQVLGDLSPKLTIAEKKQLIATLGQILEQRQAAFVGVVTGGTKASESYGQLKKLDAGTLSIAWYSEMLADLASIPEGANALTKVKLSMESAINASESVADLFGKRDFNRILEIGARSMQEHDTFTEDFKALLNRRGFRFRN